MSSHQWFTSLPISLLAIFFLVYWYSFPGKDLTCVTQHLRQMLHCHSSVRVVSPYIQVWGSHLFLGVSFRHCWTVRRLSGGGWGFPITSLKMDCLQARTGSTYFHLWVYAIVLISLVLDFSSYPEALLWIAALLYICTDSSWGLSLCGQVYFGPYEGRWIKFHLNI